MTCAESASLSDIAAGVALAVTLLLAVITALVPVLYVWGSCALVPLLRWMARYTRGR